MFGKGMSGVLILPLTNCITLIPLAESALSSKIRMIIPDIAGLPWRLHELMKGCLALHSADSYRCSGSHRDFNFFILVTGGPHGLALDFIHSFSF